MKLPVTLQNKIIDFLKSLPNIDETKSRRAFIYSAGLDAQLQDQIPFDEPPAQFVPLLVSTLHKYGRLNDGRNALEAILETAKNTIGYDKKEACNILIQELHANNRIDKKWKPQTALIRNKFLLVVGIIICVGVISIVFFSITWKESCYLEIQFHSTEVSGLNLSSLAYIEISGESKISQFPLNDGKSVVEISHEQQKRWALSVLDLNGRIIVQKQFKGCFDEKQKFKMDEYTLCTLEPK